MKKILVLLLIVIALLSVGCNNNVESSIQEIDILNIKDEQFKKLVQSWQLKNGAYWLEYGDDKNAYYLFLNSSTVVQGSKPTYFESMTVNVEANTLNINYTEKETEQPNTIKNKVLYRIPTAKPIDKVNIYRNGEEVYFETVSVLNN